MPLPDRRTVRKEIADRLCGSGIAPAAEGVGGLLQPSLKGDAREHVGTAEVLRRNGDEQPAVDVFAVARQLAHAVRDHAARFACRGDDLSAGADAEREHAAPRRRVG